MTIGATLDDVAAALNFVYGLPKEVRDQNGKTGREWVTSDEAQMTASHMCNKYYRSYRRNFNNFQT